MHPRAALRPPLHPPVFAIGFGVAPRAGEPPFVLPDAIYKYNIFFYPSSSTYHTASDSERQELLLVLTPIKKPMKPEVVTNLSPQHEVKKALCLDFDGTIRRSASGATFIRNVEDIELMPGIEKLIWAYRNMGYLILGISNQAGVAHGFKLPLEIDWEMIGTLNLFEQNPFHFVKFCYHDGAGKIEPYCHRSLLRKPSTGMLALMEDDAFDAGFVVDWDNSLFVGDRPEDEECAKNAGIPFKHIDEFLTMPHTFTI